MYYIVSNDYLAHHGVKGQKWGVRRYQNPDGSLTAAGQKRYYSAFKKQYKSDPYSYTKMPNDVDGMDAIKRLNDNIKESLDNYNKISDEIKNVMTDYHKNRSYWSAVSGAAQAVLWGDNNMYDMARRINLTVNDDLDQGYMNSAAIWAKETGKTTTLDRLAVKERDSYNNVQRNIEKEVNTILGKYGNKKISGLATAGHSMVNSILNSTDTGGAAYYLEDVSYGPKTKSDNDAVKTAKSIVAKLSLGKGKNKAWYLTEAVENCGLGDVDFKDMSDSDWRKLSNELSRLSK